MVGEGSCLLECQKALCKEAGRKLFTNPTGFRATLSLPRTSPPLSLSKRPRGANPCSALGEKTA